MSKVWAAIVPLPYSTGRFPRQRALARNDTVSGRPSQSRHFAVTAPPKGEPRGLRPAKFQFICIIRCQTPFLRFSSSKAPMLSKRIAPGLFLQQRIAEAVYEGVDLLACLAVGAVPVVVACVAGQILNGVDRADWFSCHLVHGAVDGCHACHMTAIVADCFHGAFGRKAGGNGCHQYQHMLALDHGPGK